MPDRSRTYDTQLRKLVLYPLSYGHITLIIPLSALAVNPALIDKINNLCYYGTHGSKFRPVLFTMATVLHPQRRRIVSEKEKIPLLRSNHR